MNTPLRPAPMRLQLGCGNRPERIPPVPLRDPLCRLHRDRVSTISTLTWSALPYLLRYVGCRMVDVYHLSNDHVVTIDGRLALRLSSRLRSRTIPLHPVAAEVVRGLCRDRPVGPWFPDLNRIVDPTGWGYGLNYARLWRRHAAVIFPPATVLSWRGAVWAHLSPERVLGMDAAAWVIDHQQRGAFVCRPEWDRLVAAIDSIP